MSPNKGIGVREIEREFVRLGGTVDRSRPDHVQFKYPGLPTVGVHCNRTRAPQRLVSLFRKVLAGKVVTPPRAPIIENEQPPVAPEPKKAEAFKRPNPPRPISIGGSVDIDAVRAAAVSLEQRKAQDRAAALAHLFNRPAPEAPYVAQEPSLRWAKDVIYGKDRRHDADYEQQVRAFEDAQACSMVWWTDDVFEWLEEMEPWMMPPAHRQLPREGYKRYGIAIVRPGRGLIPDHSYCFKNGDDVVVVVTVLPAEYARFRHSWEYGRDHIRRQCREKGIAL